MKKLLQGSKNLNQKKGNWNKMGRGVFLCSVILVVSSVMLLTRANDVITVTTKLDGAVQRIGTIIFATPQSNGGWQPMGQVPMSVENEKVTVSGSLLTNSNQKNTVKSTAPQHISLIGGKGNTMFSTGESTLIGGSGNTTAAFQSFIGGGEGNAITGNSQRSAILGGKQNSLVGENTIILGGERNRISGNNSVTLGNNVIITGNASLGAGSGVRLSGSGSFVWNGNGTFTVNQGNLFAVNAKRGMAVSTNKPNPFAALTVNGNIRIEANAAKNNQITCTAATAGTVKTVSGSNANVCSCLCNGTQWQPMMDTAECRSLCCGANQTRNNNTCEANCSAATIDGYAVPATAGGAAVFPTKQVNITGGKQIKQKTFTCRNGTFVGGGESIVGVVCNTNYTAQANNTCVANTRTFACAAKPAVGTVWNSVSSYTQTRNGSVWSPADSTTAYNETASTTGCRYKCATGYSWNGNACVTNTRTFTCAAKPAVGTVWNSVSSYTQTRNGSAWSPADSTTAYNVTGSTTGCRYKCATGYSWNGNACVVLPLPQCGVLDLASISANERVESKLCSGGTFRSSDANRHITTADMWSRACENEIPSQGVNCLACNKDNNCTWSSQAGTCVCTSPSQPTLSLVQTISPFATASTTADFLKTHDQNAYYLGPTCVGCTTALRCHGVTSASCSTNRESNGYLFRFAGRPLWTMSRSGGGGTVNGRTNSPNAITVIEDALHTQQQAYRSINLPGLTSVHDYNGGFYVPRCGCDGGINSNCVNGQIYTGNSDSNNQCYDMTTNGLRIYKVEWK